MDEIATLTMNPAIDLAYEVDRVFHTHKIRSHEERYDPGGGGINISRVVSRLGGTARAYYLAGGATGATLNGLLDLHQVVRHHIPIRDHTRISTAVHERNSGKEYRFVPRGPTIAPAEWRVCLEEMERVRCDYLVASGSLPRGVPDDFYSQVQRICGRRGIKLVLDSSGEGLRQGVAGGGIHLLKPSLGELRQLVGEPLEDDRAIAEAAMGLVRQGKADHVAVTMGHEGALLAQASGVTRLPAMDVEARSAVGAGDSFLAAMVFSLACGRSMIDAFRYGIAAGAAAVLTPGNDLCHLADIDAIHARMAPA